jgi:uncharacterized protein (DUF433 family)
VHTLGKGRAVTVASQHVPAGILNKGRIVLMNELLSRITINPQICFGKPCIRGTRIWVSLILDFLASGATFDEVLEDYPQLKREDVLAAIAYGAEMSRERFVDLPGSSAA